MFTSHNPYVPLISVKDPSPIPVKYISFSSATRAQFFYDAVEEIVLKAPVSSTITTTTINTLEIVEESKHPLLETLDYPIGLSELCKLLLWLLLFLFTI